jgi:hypothetical protein
MKKKRFNFNLTLLEKSFRVVNIIFLFCLSVFVNRMARRLKGSTVKGKLYQPEICKGRSMGLLSVASA